MANPTVGSHGGSFAGGFAKAFLAVMQMAMRKRQIDMMTQFYNMRMQEMGLDIQERRRLLGLGQQGREDARTRLEGFKYDTSGTGDAGGKYSTADMVKLAEKAGFKGDDAAHMAAIASAESNGKLDAKGSAGELGLTQVNPHAWGRDLADRAASSPQESFNVAKMIYDKQGWGAWSTDPSSPNFTKNNSMEKFYGTAQKALAAETPTTTTTKTADEEGKPPIPSRTTATSVAKPTAQADQPFKPYQVAGEMQPPPASSLPTPTPALGGGRGNELEVPTGTPAPDQVMTGHVPEMAVPLAGGATDARLAPAPTAAPAAPVAPQPAPAIPSAPGTVQYGVGGVRGQQPGAGGPIYTAGQLGQAPAVAGPTATASTLPATTGVQAAPIPLRGQQQVPLAQAPMPPPRPANLSGESDTSGNINPANAPSAGAQNVAMLGGTGDPLWAGYTGASPDQAASADPLNNLYSSGQNFSAESGLTDTSGLMAAGQMADIADSDLTATMYRGGPVIKYYRGGVIRRYQDGGDVASAPEPTPSSAGPPPMDPNDRDAMIKTIAGEAGGEPPIGQAAVAHTILNRVADGGYGEGIQGVVKAPVPGKDGQRGYHQFSVWNAPGMPDSSKVTHNLTPDNPLYGTIGSIVDKVHNGLIPDPTNGATHYYAPGSMPGGKPPRQWPQDWFKAAPKVKVGNQIFVGGSQGPGQGTPSTMAGYRMGGVINRYASGGDTDSDLLAEYGGTDTEDPMYEMQRLEYTMGAGTNNSDRADLPTSIMNRAEQPSPQDQPITPPPPPDTSIGEQPAAAQPAATAAPPAPDTSVAPTEQPTTEQPTTEQPTTTGQSDIPPGSVQVAGPGGWGSAGRGAAREYTHIPMPRVGGMGGGMRGMGGMGRMGGGRTINARSAGGQPLYVPGYIGDEDYNHLGIAPTHNSDGNPSVWLMNMVDNGVRALFTGFGFANQGAMPNSPQTAQNLQLFGSNENPGMLSKGDMKSLGKLYDPHGDFIEGAAEIGGAVSMIKYYALTGQLDAASRLSGGVLLYTRMMSMEYGDEAVKSLFNGDYKNAVKYLEKGYNWVPDAKTAEATDIDTKTGKVHAIQKDGNGKVIAEQDYLPAAIMKAALGLKDGTGYWNMLSSIARAGGNDPLGSHYETQRLLRGIQGNQDVPMPPAAAAAPKDGTLPITTPDSTAPSPDSVSTSPDQTAPPPAPDTTITPPDQAAPPTTAPPIPDRNAGPNQNVGQAAPPPTAQPAQAMATRSDIVPPNLVAGPGASSTIQPQPVSTGGSGAVLVAQEKARAEQAQQAKAVDRMIQGGQFDGDDPYVQTKIADIQKRVLAPLQAQRTAMENQLTEIEGADISPAEKRQLQVALVGQIKNFDETRLKPAATAARQEYNQFASGLKQQFTAKMAIVKRQQKVEDIANTYDNQRVAAEQKRQAALDPNNPQMRAHEGIFPDGSPLEDKAGNRVLSYGEQITKNLNDKDATDPNVDANPISRFIRSGNPWLSSSYDGNDPTTVDMSKVPDTLFKPADRKTMNMSARDMIMYNGGTLTYRDAQDFTTGVATGAYTIQRIAHPKIHSRVLGDLNNDDGIPRTDVLISRGLNDQNPERVVMSTDNANRLAELAKKSETVSIHNRAMADIRAPEGPTYPQSPALTAQPPPTPNSASNSQQQPPPQSTAPIPPRQTPTPFTPNTIQQPNYDIPENAPTVGSTAMDFARWLKEHGILQRGQPQPNPFR